MAELTLRGLDGKNPLAFLAALGALGVLDRMRPSGEVPTLRWTESLTSRPVVTGARSVEELVEVVLADRDAWCEEVPLSLAVLDDVKLAPEELHSLMQQAVASWPGARRGVDLLAALVAEGALAGNGRESKPTALHFTAGQQRFLRMARELAAGLSPDHVHEAVTGPWRYESTLPVLSWDGGGERLYGMRATDPAKDKKRGVPGADWLAFVGLSFLPVAARRTDLRTTACGGTWKRGSFRWPLWSGAASPAVSRVVVGLGGLSLGELSARSVFTVVESRIRRSDQGGYGSFAPAVAVW